MAETITQSGLFDWSMGVLRQLEAIRTPILDKLMSLFTVLGQEMAFIVVGLILVWCIDKRFGYRFLLMYMLGTSVNQVVKAIFMIPRPWAVDPELTIVESARDGATGFSFPSGHTQSGVLMYGGVAAKIKKGWAYFVACALALLIGFSRMYLGVHTPLDVITALVMGVVILLICMRPNSNFGEKRGPYLIAVGAVLLLSFGLVLFIKKVCANAEIPYYSADEAKQLVSLCLKDAWVLVGTCAGLFLGYAVESKFIDYSTEAVWWVQIIKALLGLAIVVGLRMVLKPLLAHVSDSVAMDGVRYFLMSFVALGVYPLLFKPLSRLGKKA